jgi:hypothetical protein
MMFQAGTLHKHAIDNQAVTPLKTQQSSLCGNPPSNSSQTNLPRKDILICLSDILYLFI